ncbi:MAG: TIGR02530 family flagellar biosynthesis protein [Dethiobacteraceae bacterium]|jgi:flagellar operon protein|nr:hypothetical protein [Bacillota bacterium]
MKVNRPLYPPALPAAARKSVKQEAAAKAEVPFAQVLQQQLSAPQPLKFSAHVLQRLQERQIELAPQDVTKLSRALQAAREKGSQSSLLLYQDIAFVASVKNNTIITAVKGDDLQDRVFTNIDSAVMIK